VLGLLAAAAYLYYQPLASYVDTRNELAASRTEVELLRATKERLEQRLAFATSEEATRREARRIGYVRPGEQLFIVKGIPDWRRSHRRTLRGDG
jgi:cell division protein FtsB